MRMPLTAIVAGALLCACAPGIDAETAARNELALMATTVNRLLTLNLDHAPSCSSLKECMDEIDLRLAALDTDSTLDGALRDSLASVYLSLWREANREMLAVRTAIVRTPPLPPPRPPGTAPYPASAPSQGGATSSGGRVVASFRWVEGPDPSIALEIEEIERHLEMIRNESTGRNPRLPPQAIDPVVFLEARLDSLRALQEGRSP